jgi:hypothetical protein
LGALTIAVLLGCAAAALAGVAVAVARPGLATKIRMLHLRIR